MAITHDRYFLDNVAEWILELDRGKTHPYEGNYSTYLETKKDRLVVEGRKDAKRQRILERELEWVRSNPKARQAKSKSRLARYEELAAEAERGRRIDLQEINIPAGPRLGDLVLESRGWPRVSATAPSSTTCPSRSRGRASWGLSGRTASERRPCSGWSRGRRSQMPVS